VNGAELTMKTALKAGVKVCFTNFGTTEIPLARSFDTEPGIKPVLGLFEGVCTGAADGYGRMLDKPALTLLHLGPGFANGIANLHNAKRAKTPIVNVVGEHATSHIPLDAPLAMDIEALAGTLAGWHRTNQSPLELSRDMSDALEAAAFGQIATLIIPNDYQQAEIDDTEIATAHFVFDPVDEKMISSGVRFFRKYHKVALILGGRALRQSGLQTAARIKNVTGCDLLTDNLPGYIDRSPELPEVARIPYFPEPAIKMLSQYEAAVIVGTKEPVSFFGYRGVRGKMLADDQPRIIISSKRQNPAEALNCLADALGTTKSGEQPKTLHTQRPALAGGVLTAEKACQTLAAIQPEGAIIIDEGVTSVSNYYQISSHLPRHSLLTIAGGSIGYGPPCSVGAAVACPDRPVIAIQADGSAMYTIQALWTQAREKLNITTLICSNRRYNILKVEIERAGITGIGPFLKSLYELDNPSLNWVKMGEAMGVPGVAVNTAEQLAEELKAALSSKGPHLIEMELE
jgi:acetolactate synthase I/II/III large subunit